jgi:hypothetical protein
MTSKIRAPLNRYIRCAFAIDFVATCLAARFIQTEPFVYFVGVMLAFAGGGLLYEYGKKEPRSNLSILFILLGLAAGSIWNGVATTISLRNNRVVTSAVVINEGYDIVDKQRIRWIEYRFVAGDHAYITRNESESYAVADTIAINYDSTNPGISEPASGD